MVSYMFSTLHALKDCVDMDWFVVPTINTNVGAAPHIRRATMRVSKQVNCTLIAVMPVSNGIVKENESILANL